MKVYKKEICRDFRSNWYGDAVIFVLELPHSGVRILYNRGFQKNTKAHAAAVEFFKDPAWLPEHVLSLKEARLHTKLEKICQYIEAAIDVDIDPLPFVRESHILFEKVEYTEDAQKKRLER